MKIRVGGLAAIIGCAALCLALPALGQNSITVTGVNGSTSSDNNGNLLSSSVYQNEDVYTGIYYATVNNSTMTPVICDDFNHSENLNQTWNATAINTSSLNSTSIMQTEFGAKIGLVGYAEVATLVSEIFALNNATGTFDGLKVSGTDLSEAIWDITTPGGLSGITKNAGLLVAYVEGLFTGPNAATNAQNYLHTLSLWILTPNPIDSSSPQELWAAPEGGSAFLYLLLAGISCFGAMFFSSRNQRRNRETA